jgi:uncharacterized membrane protein YraQ (UPF0718 family)
LLIALYEEDNILITQLATYIGYRLYGEAGIAIAAGVLSHGSMIAWYPMLRELRYHGMRDGFMAAFFYARAVKVPMLPVMVKYFGWKFTLLLTTFTLAAAAVQGLIIEYIFLDRSFDPGSLHE